MKGLLISGGEKPSKELLLKLCENSDFIICADGGLNYLVDLNILPNILVGDLDSVDEKAKIYIEENSIEVIKLNPEKDESDTEMALKHLIDKGIKEINIISAIGSRMDHTLGNIFILKRLYNISVNATIINDNNEIIYMETESRKIFKDNFKYLSIIPLDEKLIYSTQGMKYEVSDLELEFGSTQGLSNEIIKKEANIIVNEGSCLIIKSRD